LSQNALFKALTKRKSGEIHRCGFCPGILAPGVFNLALYSAMHLWNGSS
jgi:hypothetical protein